MNETMNKTPSRPVVAVVTGMEHSGTSYLASLIKMHPGIGSGFECGLLLADCPAGFVDVRPFYEWMQIDKPNQWQISPEGMKDIRAASSWNEAYAKIMRHSPLFDGGKEFLLDKTPGYIRRLDTVLAKVPEVPCIVLRKHITLQYYSSKKRNWLMKRRKEWSLQRFVDHYIQSYEGLRRAVEAFPERILTIDHDALSRDALAQIQRIFDFTGLDRRDVPDLEEQIERTKTGYRSNLAGKSHDSYDFDREMEEAHEHINDDESRVLAALPELPRCPARDSWSQRALGWLVPRKRSA